jgi:nucleoside-diphosphate-sugar epimerase
MRILITGAGGFVGRTLLKALLAKPALAGRGGAARAESITEIILTDISEAALAGLPDDPRLAIRAGNIADDAFRRTLLAPPVDTIFHFAATLTTDAEHNFERGLETNVLSLIRLLDDCRAGDNCTRFLYPSSIAAFGGPLPGTIGDHVAQTPQTSYGTAKSIAELLINDYSRHGFINGRILRLPVVLIRTGAPSPSVSDKVAAIVREPLHGRDVVCGLAPGTLIPVASARSVAEALIRLHDVPADRFGHTRAMNLPSLTVSVTDMIASLEGFDHPGPRGRILWERDEQVQGIVDSWPRYFISEEASRLGLQADASFTDILRAYVEDYAVR